MTSTEFPRRELVFEEQANGSSLLLKRNCSISPGSMLRVFGLLALASLGIALGFAFAGAWLILPFAGLEVLALGAAFVVHARHATDFERIEVSTGRLTVEIVEADRVARYVLDPRVAKLRLEKDEGFGARVLLRAPGRDVEIGRHLDAEARVVFATELMKKLRI
ncbi:MAG: DUF2244 domain-containing protein [Burkholderiales bacterium]|jgi:uncharacterized membrane protein